MLTTVFSAALIGIEAWAVEVEVNPGEPGEPRVVIVGLPTTAVKESKDRVWAAVANSGHKLPFKKMTINLAPGNLRKEGATYDLPIALAVLKSTGQLQADNLEDYLIAGELGLSGQVRSIRGGLALATCARAHEKKVLILPERTAKEAALVRDVEVYAVSTLQEACAFIEGRIQIPRMESSFESDQAIKAYSMDFEEIKGQGALRRAVEVAVAGSHNLLMLGPPGSGKSMIAKRISTIMPKLRESEYLEILRIYSATGRTLHEGGLRPERPFRSPHHTISDVGLIGGGAVPGPGEISLAHHGVLFLDELPEFKRSALEVLRQPLEDAVVTISRSAGRITLPARCMLVAAMNPTPDGGGPEGSQSSPAQVERYRSRVSGPLLDRIDIHVEAPALTIEELRAAKTGENSQTIRERVEAARQIQTERFNEQDYQVNAGMSPAAIRKFCPLSNELGDLLQQAMEKLHLSARAYDRILKVSRTIADLDGAEKIDSSHLLEAIQYRSLDRNRSF